MAVLTTVLALVIAPLVVIHTHGPAAHAAAAAMAVEATESIAAHGHAHDDAGHHHPGNSFGGHNAADHDHPLHALIGQAASAPGPLPDTAPFWVRDVFRILTLDGPMRPPRPV